ncbi:MAG: hypothetical protein AAF656_03600 [Planctomycetota bacterium]
MRLNLALLVVSIFALTGCATYTTPGGPADFAALGVTAEMRAAQDAGTDDSRIREAFDRKPLATFPARLAVVRVQGVNYRSHTTRGYGYGRYSIVSLRDLEAGDNDPLARLQSMPMVHAVAPLNRIVVGNQLNTDNDIRVAAAQLQADILLIYTFDTQFRSQQQAAPLSVISLGLAPTKDVRVTTTASAIVMDTRSGFIYGLAEKTESSGQVANAWTSGAAIDQTRRRVERRAFDGLLGEVEVLWADIVDRHGENLVGS